MGNVSEKCFDYVYCCWTREKKVIVSSTSRVLGRGEFF